MRPGLRAGPRLRDIAGSSMKYTWVHVAIPGVTLPSFLISWRDLALRIPMCNTPPTVYGSRGQKEGLL